VSAAGGAQNIAPFLEAHDGHASVQAGVDITVIALWLGHESPVTTHGYVEADLAMKERALATLAPPETKRKRYRPSDAVLKFLESP
jgi:hypothetical protein